jgi:hypothetical protein
MCGDTIISVQGQGRHVVWSINPGPTAELGPQTSGAPSTTMSLLNDHTRQCFGAHAG